MGPFIPPYTIASLFPRKSINLLIGTPKVGRMRFLLPQIANYAAARPFLNIPVPDSQPSYPYRPEQLGMLLCARTYDAIQNKLRQLDLENLTNFSTFPIVKWDCPEKEQSDPLFPFPLKAPYEALETVAGRPPRFLLIESLHLLLPDRKYLDPYSVAIFTDKLHQFCSDNDCTILGTVEMAKAKRGDHYEHLSHRIAGTAQWGVAASCLIGIERFSTDSVATSTMRKVTIQASESRQEIPPLYMDFNLQGHLVPCPKPDSPRESKQAILDRKLDLVDPGAEFTRRDFLLWGADSNIGARTVDKWIATGVELGFLVRKGSTSSTVYQKPQPN